MTAKLLAEHAGAEAWHATWAELANVVAINGGCDAVIVDAPYSEKTHSGHNKGKHRDPSTLFDEKTGLPCRNKTSRPINYEPWSQADVESFVETWSQLARGWLVSVTDHSLAPVWAEALERAGRYVFAPLAYVAQGSRIRLAGDGPSQWACWIVVSRPRTREAQRWRTLDGAYVLPPGYLERMAVVGGKPLWLMERLVIDYSRHGDLVVDPCAGAFTCGVACQRTGRRFVGGDALEAHARLGAERISRPAQAPLFDLGGGQLTARSSAMASFRQYQTTPGPDVRTSRCGNVCATCVLGAALFAASLPFALAVWAMSLADGPSRRGGR